MQPSLAVGILVLQAKGLIVSDHNVVAKGETAQFFAVASVNGSQIAVAKIDFGKQQPCAAVGGRRFSRGRLKMSTLRVPYVGNGDFI